MKLKVPVSRKIRFHDLWRAAIMLLISKGVDIKTVKEVAGHADISTKMNYVHMIGGSVERLSDTFVIEHSVNRKEKQLKLLKSGGE